MKLQLIAMLVMGLTDGSGLFGIRDTEHAPQEPVQQFVLQDGYFQANPGRRPVHLVHESGRQGVASGDQMTVWYTIAVKAGEQNLCSPGEVTTCRFSAYLGKTDLDVSQDFVVGEDRQNQITVGVRALPLTTRWPPFKGDTDLVLTIKKNGIELFSHKIPIKVE